MQDEQAQQAKVQTTKKGKGQSFSGSRLGSFNARQLAMTQFALQAGALLEAGKADEAPELLEPLLETIRVPSNCWEWQQ
jgi:hypothetical protein